MMLIAETANLITKQTVINRWSTSLDNKNTSHKHQKPKTSQAWTTYVIRTPSGMEPSNHYVTLLRNTVDTKLKTTNPINNNSFETRIYKKAVVFDTKNRQIPHISYYCLLSIITNYLNEFISYQNI